MAKPVGVVVRERTVMEQLKDAKILPVWIPNAELMPSIVMKSMREASQGGVGPFLVLLMAQMAMSRSAIPRN